MELAIRRRPTVRTATAGVLTIGGVFACYTLEDAIRERPGVPVSAWKVPKLTAITAGRYRVTAEHSGRFGPQTLTINAVPGFTGIRIHAGNTDADTEGCPLVGQQLVEDGGGAPEVRRSRLALDALKVQILAALATGPVYLTITNPGA